MRDLPILTTELTLKIERSFAPMPTSTPSENGSQVVRFGDTIASRQFGDWPPSRVFCFNGNDVGRLDEILAFFGQVKPPFYLGHAGYSPAVATALTDAGYAMTDWKQAVLYGLPLPNPPALPRGVTIEAVTAATTDEFADVTADANGWAPQWAEQAKVGVRQSLVQPGVVEYLARLNGQPAGVAELSNGPGHFAMLSSTAVLPAFRGRGIQTALLRHRLHSAFLHGDELVIGGADFGSVSFRNQQRVGMRPAYIETTWRHSTKEHGATAAEF